MYCIRKLVHPEIFQGENRTKHYFEGWYYKLIDRRMEHAVAIIPGISIGKDLQDAHAFIQVLGENNKVEIFRFPLEEFRYSKQEFIIKIADNYFSQDKIRINLKGDRFSIKGKLEFYDIARLPKTLRMPGIMGPYSYIPFMECYHGIINIHHKIMGSLKISDKTVDFTDGYGYIEKDWGKSFPKTWIWLQSNHFESEEVTLMFSAARIPWLGGSFPGFISFLRIKDEIYLFATYTKARIRRLNYSNKNLEVILEDRRYRMELKAVHTEGGILKAPKNGFMSREISESIKAEVNVVLLDKKGNLLYEGKGTNTGLEIVL